MYIPNYNEMVDNHWIICGNCHKPTILGDAL